MGKSSINIQPAKGGSEIHNQRQKELDYVRPELSHLNSSYQVKSIGDARREINDLYFSKIGQKMQSTATPIREGVLLVDDGHTISDLQRVAQAIEKEFGIKAIQGYIHKDEGHLTPDHQWKPNLHAHLVFDWQDKATGKSIKLNRQDMSKLQTLVANELGLERGHSSSKEHLQSLQFKNQAEEKRLEKTYGLSNSLSDATKRLQEVERAEKTLEPLRREKMELEVMNSALRSNKNFLEKQNEVERQTLEKLKEQQQSRGIRR